MTVTKFDSSSPLRRIRQEGSGVEIVAPPHNPAVYDPQDAGDWERQQSLSVGVVHMIDTFGLAYKFRVVLGFDGV